MFGGQITGFVLSHLLQNLVSPMRLQMADIISWLKSIDINSVNGGHFTDNSRGRDTEQDLVKITSLKVSFAEASFLHPQMPGQDSRAETFQKSVGSMSLGIASVLILVSDSMADTIRQSSFKEEGVEDTDSSMSLGIASILFLILCSVADTLL